MIAEEIGGEADGFLRRDGAVGPHFEDELVVVGHLADARAFDVIVHAADRRMDRVDGDVAERQIAVGVAVGDLVAAAALETRFELERAFLRQRGDVRRRIEDLDVGVLLEVGGGDDARPLLLEVQRLRTFAVQLKGTCLRLRTTSVMSSTTPVRDENSWSTPSTRTAVIAAPSMDESSTRRSALPIVVPKPRSNGWAIKRP